MIVLEVEVEDDMLDVVDVEQHIALLLDVVVEKPGVEELLVDEVLVLGLLVDLLATSPLRR